MLLSEPLTRNERKKLLLNGPGYSLTAFSGSDIGENHYFRAILPIALYQNIARPI
jgi:hypothetical protein